jgi:leucyl aminopeptidase
MSVLPVISFVKLSAPERGTAVLLATGEGRFAESATGFSASVTRGMAAAEFKGGLLKALELIAPQESDLDRIVVVGVGKPGSLTGHDWLKLGATAYAKAGKRDQTIMLDLPDGVTPDQAATFAQGILLRAYEFDAYKTKKKSEDEEEDALGLGQGSKGQDRGQRPGCREEGLRGRRSGGRRRDSRPQSRQRARQYSRAAGIRGPRVRTRDARRRD